MANEIYSKSWWGSGACDNNEYWGYIYHSYACGNDNSFFGRFGTPESAYSLRNLTNNPNQFVARISNGEEEFDIKENEIFEFNKYETIRVVIWYDQAGIEQDLTAFFPHAPFLIKDGKLQTENAKPTLLFNSDCFLVNQERNRAEEDLMRGYLTASFSNFQEIGEDGNRIITDVTKFPTTLLSWQPQNSFKSQYYRDINQNNLGPTLRNKQDLFIFESDYLQLALYNISGALTIPYNFMLGQNTNMNISEFILYDDKERNVEEVTENIIDDYKIENKPVGPKKPPFEEPPFGEEPIG